MSSNANNLKSKLNIIYNECFNEFCIKITSYLRGNVQQLYNIDYINRTLHVERQLGKVPMSKKEDFKPKSK